MPVPFSRITKNTVTIKSIHDLSYDLDKDSYKSHFKRANIWFWSGCDKEGKFTARLEFEWSLCPLINKKLGEYSPRDTDKKEHLIAVFIETFFNDGDDFCFLIRGAENMNRFLGMTFSGRAYEEPCFATPLHAIKPSIIFKTRGLDRNLFERVSKTETKGIRWRFLYGSAMKAWEQLEFNEDKYQSIRLTIDNMKEMPIEEDSEDSSDEDSSDEDSSDDDLSDDDLSDEEVDGKCED